MGPLERDEILYGDDLDQVVKPPEIESGEDGRNKANWHLRKILALKAEAETEAEMFKAEIDRLRERAKELADRRQAEIDWHAGPLQQWHQMERAAGRTRGKKLVLPAGSLQLRASTSVEVLDEEALRAFLESATDPATGEIMGLSKRVFRVTERLMSSELKALTKPESTGLEPGSTTTLRLKSTGEIVSGARVSTLPDTWTVSPS